MNRERHETKTISQNQVTCPKCGHAVNIEKAKFAELDAALKQKYELKLSQARQLLSRELKNQIQEEQSQQIATLQNALDEQTEKVKVLYKSQAEIALLKREKDELRDAIELEYQQRLTSVLNEEKSKLSKVVFKQAELQLAQKDELINQLKENLKSAQRKVDQSTSQIQGEVQERAIEKWLKDRFPLDTIEEIKKGERGADCLQIVNTKTEDDCGSIYYESKRAKTFQRQWIEKFKEDIRAKNANIGVLVTETRPQGMTRLCQIGGIWVCDYEEFKGLCMVLRAFLIQLHGTVVAEENKEEKTKMLYQYLTGVEFKQQVEAIVEGFSQLQIDLGAEKRAMQAIWKKREKQIEKVLNNTTLMYASIKGIAGNAIQTVPILELGFSNDD